MSHEVLFELPPLPVEDLSCGPPSVPGVSRHEEAALEAPVQPEDVGGAATLLEGLIDLGLLPPVQGPPNSRVKDC